MKPASLHEDAAHDDAAEENRDEVPGEGQQPPEQSAAPEPQEEQGEAPAEEEAKA